jgi:hypothetical protein
MERKIVGGRQRSAAEGSMHLLYEFAARGKGEVGDAGGFEELDASESDAGGGEVSEQVLKIAGECRGRG